MESIMDNANATVIRRSAILWIGTGLILSFNLFAASQADYGLTRWALGLTGGFALFGVAFGVWAARKVTARD